AGPSHDDRVLFGPVRPSAGYTSRITETRGGVRRRPRLEVPHLSPPWVVWDVRVIARIVRTESELESGADGDTRQISVVAESHIASFHILDMSARVDSELLTSRCRAFV